MKHTYLRHLRDTKTPKDQKDHVHHITWDHTCTLLKPRRYAVRAVASAYASGNSLKLGKSIRGGVTSVKITDVVSIADSAALRYRSGHFLLHKKPLPAACISRVSAENIKI